MNNLKSVVYEMIGIDLNEESTKWLDESSGYFEREDLRCHLKDLFNGAAENPVVVNAMIDSLLDKTAAAAITRHKNIKFIDSGGQIDYLALQSMVVNVDRGGYIRMEFANIDALALKDDEQTKNIDDAVASRKQFRDAVNPVRTYMQENGIEAFGEALKKMGFI